MFCLHCLKPTDSNMIWKREVNSSKINSFNFKLTYCKGWKKTKKPKKNLRHFNRKMTVFIAKIILKYGTFYTYHMVN